MSMVRFLLLSVTVSLDFRHAAATTAGLMTMWSSRSDIIEGSGFEGAGDLSTCKFADADNGGLHSPAANSPYIKNSHYCVANVKTLFAGGQACGKCYQISYRGGAGGQTGSAVIQVVGSGDMEWGAVFDCQITAFEKITGAHSGVYSIDYTEVNCDTSSGGGRATLLSDAGAYHGKFVFSNLVHPATKVTLVADKVEHELVMDPCCGTWSGPVGEQHASVGFKLILSDGSLASFQNCFDNYGMQRRSAFCQQYVAPSYEKCAKNWGDGRDSCTNFEYGVCVGYQPGGTWGECHQTPEDPSNQNCDGNFGSDADNACRDPSYRACYGHQSGNTWGKCFQLVSFDPSDQDCCSDKDCQHNCMNPEYPLCVGFELHVTWGKCRQPHADPSFGKCQGDSDCQNDPYSKCVGNKPGRWGSCIEGASADLPSSVAQFGLPHQSHMMALVSCTLPALIILGLAARWRSRTHLPEPSGLMGDE